MIPKPLRPLLLLSAVSRLGDQLLYVAMPLLVLAETGQPAYAILAAAARGLPYVISPFIGAVVDRYPLRTVYVAAQLIQAVAIGAIPLLKGQPSIVLLLLMISGVGGVCSSLLNFYKLIPLWTPQEQIEAAIGRFVALTDAVKVVGPLVAISIVLSIGAPAAIYADAVSFLVAALGIAFILPATQKSEVRRTSLAQDLKEGFRYFKGSPEIRRLTTAMSLSNLGIGALEVLLLTTLTHSMQIPVAQASLALSVGACAGLAGSGLTRKIFPRLGTTQRITVWLALAGVGALCLTVPHPLMFVLGFVVISFATSASNVITIAYRQSTIPSELQGRVNSIIRMFISGAVPISGILLAALGTYTLGVSQTQFVALMCILAVIVWQFGASGERQNMWTKTS
ncbi:MULTISPECIES: MFS transporter [unclassified Deinococcus]|uniref:MFS transporter n=1 Tax=unclassified Deinococcus TaxID=2623546 RepID=UPI0009CF67EF|nr:MULTISPECIES: MFS transporter [unclassified Deinococcus]MBX8465820.1 MFS transporter [Deinococcus sp. RIT780]OOV12099.1 hypothetical protein BXU09_17425 [Deinococcus sp. LM3]OOV12275.1 hypothetical protein BXU09_18450 [Deinococcus sp. LM3]